ncbi:glycerophosphodiester phosphodiesterase 1-like isoform X2 [Biomphalaria glabrata]|uniref:Glycerophosphodiester phosphodiesterase 1-like isoform X2 n=1 Tax=Biomphalaria glabrata TaxID=6526 RepID=A0A9W2ZK95_BIOGL|nr:glycerophosphodiester phosphodiesterase 1-like isoform X2 [Biomphalaria glabrata]
MIVSWIIRTMAVSQRTAVMTGNMVLLWLFINTFITSVFVWSFLVTASVLAAIQYVKISPVNESRISQNILQLFAVDKDNVKSNTIFHKAGGFHAPENTLEAVEQAITMGIPAIEIDLDFTKDGVGVLIHGPKVDATTDSKGFVSDFTFQQIQELNAAANDVNRNKYPVARIPTLESCIEICVRNNLVVFIDCKSNPKETAKLVTSLYAKHPKLYDLGIVCSFYPTIIYAVRKADPNILTALTHRNLILSELGQGTERNKELWKKVISPWLDILLSWAHWSILWYICGNSFFLCNKDNVCLDHKKFWKGLGIRMVIWTVNSEHDKNYFLRSLNIPIITDGLYAPQNAQEHEN